MNAPHRAYLRGRRLMEAICVESAQTEQTYAEIQRLLDHRLLIALRLLRDSSAEYAVAVAVLQRIMRATDVRSARSAARKYLTDIGRA